MFLYGILFSIIGAVSMGAFGYYKGYKICSQTQEVKLLKAEIKRLNLSHEYMKASIEAEKQISEENKRDSQLNKELINDLSTQIEAEKAKVSDIATSCTLDADWLQRVDTIR